MYTNMCVSVKKSIKPVGRNGSEGIVSRSTWDDRKARGEVQGWAVLACVTFTITNHGSSL